MPLLFASDRSLSEFSTFGIGGKIRYFSEIKTIEEMGEALAFAREKKLPFLVLGKGSNCLFSDLGFNGVVLLNRIDFCAWKENVVRVGSGFSFSLLGSQTAKKGFSGLEFASGIPASVGGAVFMNAGANGRETSDCLISVEYMHADGTISEYKKEDLDFSYRTSSFQKMKGAILAAAFHLEPNSCDARQKQLQIIEARKKTQPLKEKSIGCIFRNPSKEKSAGLLIDESGLKGFAVGNAKVSEIHANFIVNKGGAQAKEVLKLIHQIQEKVLEKTNVFLEPEIWVIPYEP